LDYIQKAGIKDFPQVLLNGIPLKEKYLTENTFEEGVVSEIMAQTPEIQKAVYNVRLLRFLCNVNDIVSVCIFLQLHLLELTSYRINSFALNLANHSKMFDERFFFIFDQLEKEAKEQILSHNKTDIFR